MKHILWGVREKRDRARDRARHRARDRARDRERDRAFNINSDTP
jgi:hypothetical protein